MPVTQIARIAGDLDFDRAAALTVTYGTAYHALADRAALRAGETLAVIGASGGVGLAAVELGKAMGARVIACASTDDKLDFARAHGAHEVVNYAKENLRDALKRLGGEHGIDVVFDPVGGPYSEPALRSLAWEGRLLVVGFAAGDIPKLPLNLVLLKGCNVLGVFWSSWMKRDVPRYQAALGELAQWCAQGKLSAHVQRVYPLAETPKASARWRIARSWEAGGAAVRFAVNPKIHFCASGAIPSIAVASFTSRAVTPPASCVEASPRPCCRR